MHEEADEVQTANLIYHTAEPVDESEGSSKGKGQMKISMVTLLFKHLV